jgi:hypothetical protein
MREFETGIALAMPSLNLCLQFPNRKRLGWAVSSRARE